MVTPEQILLVQNSMRRIFPIRDTVARLFFSRLFWLDPSLRGVFHVDLEQQGCKLMVALGFLAHGLNDLERNLPLVHQLGQRHAGYGIEPRHYETVGAALLWALAQGQGEDFTDDTRQAWVAAYSLLSSTMIEAATSKAA